MKTLPTAPTVPSSSFRVWLTIAPPLEASALGLRQIVLRGCEKAEATSELGEGPFPELLRKSK